MENSSRLAARNQILIRELINLIQVDEAPRNKYQPLSLGCSLDTAFKAGKWSALPSAHGHRCESIGDVVFRHACKMGLVPAITARFHLQIGRASAADFSYLPSFCFGNGPLSTSALWAALWVGA